MEVIKSPMIFVHIELDCNNVSGTDLKNMIMDGIINNERVL